MIKTTFNLCEDYQHIVSFSECLNIGKYEFKVDSKWLSAKNPDDPQTKFTWLMTAYDLRKLRNMIDETLSSYNIVESTSWLEP